MKDDLRYGVAATGVVPVRQSPSDTSEMVNQLLLGETFRMVARDGVWSRIIADYDGYEGWVSSGQIRDLQESDYHQWIQHPDRIRFPNRSILAYRSSHHWLQIPAGAYVPVISNGIDWFGEEYHFVTQPVKIVSESVTDTARGFLGVSYLWGGRTDSGIDCSGFVQTSYMLHGVSVPRDSTQQYESGRRKGEHLQDAEPGDIIYFKYCDRPVTHIGFYLGDGLLLHASAQVKIEQIDPKNQTENHIYYNKSLAEGIVGVVWPFSDDSQQQ